MLSSRVSRNFIKKLPTRQLLSRSRAFLPVASTGMKWVPESVQNWMPCRVLKKDFSSAPPTNENALHRIEAGRFDGVLNNPADEVFETLDNFYNLSWVDFDAKVDKVGPEIIAGLLKSLEAKPKTPQEVAQQQARKNLLNAAQKIVGAKLDPTKPPQIRRIRYPKAGNLKEVHKTNEKGETVTEIETTYDIDIYDIRLPPTAGQQLRYGVYVNKLKYMNQNLTKLLQSSMIVVTQQLQELENRQCRYTMQTEVSAPYTMVKLLNAPLDMLNGVYYKALFKKYNLEDFVLELDDLPMKLSKVIDFLDFQADNAKGEYPVEFEQVRPGLFAAAKMPNTQYGIRYEKLMTIASSFAAVPIEKVYNMFVNDVRTAKHAVGAIAQGQAPQMDDPWKSMYRAPMTQEEFNNLSKEDQKEVELSNEEFLSYDLYGLKLPDFITKDNNYMKDEIFAEYFFNGGNPFTVKKVQKLQKVKGIDEFKKTLKDDLEGLTKNGNLFYLDYSDFEEIQYPEVLNNMTGHAPIVLLKKDGTNYSPLGIYVEAKFGAHGENPKIKRRVFTPPKADAPKYEQNIWRLAKMHVNVTDILFFQMFVHLGKAHLLSEPLAVSIYNNLIATKRGENGTKKASNPLGTIMASYARGLLGINHLALITLVDDKQAFIDSVFVGGAAKLMEIAKDKMMVNFLLKEQSPHVDLTNRGFSQSDLKNKEFGYAYYSTQLYDLINGYMNNVVGHVYKSDADVKNDTDLKNMKDQLSSMGFKIGFELDSKKNLAEFASCHIWTLTGFHSMAFAVNDFDAYFPFRYSSLTKPLPLDQSNDKQVTDTYVQESLPFPTKQIVTHVLLNAVGKRMEPSLLETPNPFKKDTEAELYKFYEEFHNGLQTLEKNYSAHMDELKGKDKMQFDYLKPSMVENCLSI